MIISYLHLLFRNCLLPSIPHFLWENQGSRKRAWLGFTQLVCSLIHLPNMYWASPMCQGLCGALGYNTEKGETDKGHSPWSIHQWPRETKPVSLWNLIEPRLVPRLPCQPRASCFWSYTLSWTPELRGGWHRESRKIGLSLPSSIFSMGSPHVQEIY